MGILKQAGMAAVAIVFIAACGGSPAAPSAPPITTPGPVASTPVTGTPTPAPVGVTNPPVGGTVDICSLLTPAELNAATGKEYLAGTLDTVGQCLWNTDDSGTNSGDLIVGYIQPQTLSFLKSAFGSGGVDVTVAGHGAFYNPTRGLQTLWVDIGGGQILSISFPQSDDLDPSYQAIALQLGEAALSKM